MKKLLSLFLATVFVTVALSSCSLTTNYIDVDPLCVSELDGETYLLSVYIGENCKMDFENRTVTMVQNDALPAFEEAKTKNAFKFEQFHGVYDEIGNEALKTHLKSCELTEGDSLVYAFGYWQNEILVGFVQVYDGYARTCSGYDLANLHHSLIFKYDASADTFTVTKEIVDVAIVALARDTAIYWKKRAYYSYNLQTGEETYLTEDKAFDAGLKNFARPHVYYNQDMCILHLFKDEDKIFYFVFNFETKEFFELRLQK